MKQKPRKSVKEQGGGVSAGKRGEMAQGTKEWGGQDKGKGVMDCMYFPDFTVFLWYLLGSLSVM